MIKTIIMSTKFKLHWIYLSLILYLATTVFSLFAQDTTKFNFPASFQKLSHIEYEHLQNMKNSLNGNYYVSTLINGKLIFIQIVRYDKGKKHGEQLVFHQAFNQLLLVSINNYKYGIKHGYFFSHTDTFIEEGNYKKGKKEGLWKYENILSGTNEVGFFKKDKKQGIWTREDKTSIENISFKAGVKSGKYSYRDKTTEMTVTGFYKKEQKHGLWIIDYGITIEKEYYYYGKLLQK